MRSPVFAGLGAAVVVVVCKAVVVVVAEVVVVGAAVVEVAGSGVVIAVWLEAMLEAVPELSVTTVVDSEVSL